jgi:hypothetical protein
MPKHRCAALMIFHDAETPLCNTVAFHFSDAETPLSNTGDFAETPATFLPDAETPLFSTFHFPPISKNIPVRHSPIIAETTPSSTCFDFSPSIAGTPLPVAETPAIFHFLSRC